MKHTQQACDAERLESYLHGRLDEQLEHEVETHIDSCESCRYRMEQYAAEPASWEEAIELLGDPRWRNEEHPTSLTNRPSNDSQNNHRQIQSVIESLAPTDDPAMLGRIDGYEISGVIGCGGMGAVLKGFDRSLNRVVAIKVMAPHLASSGAARMRFAREAQAAAAMTHDNVIDIYGVSEANGLPYLVMPYARGPSLQKRIDDRGPLPVVEVLRIGSQIAAGLAAAHAQGLVHRDIKPANILLNDGVDGRINAIHVRGNKVVVKEVVDLLELLDVAEPKSKVSETDLPKQDLSKPQLSNAADVTSEFLKQAVADFRQRVEDLDRQSRGIADQLKQSRKNPAEAEKLHVLLRTVVQKSFATRQEMRRKELELFAVRLRDLKQSVELRDRIADKIIDRRIDELLDPNLRWGSSEESAPLVGALPTNVPSFDRSQRVLAFLRVDKSESNENIRWLTICLEAIGITNFTVTRGGKPSIVDILCPHDLPSDERSRLERDIKALEKEAPFEWILHIATAGPPKHNFKPNSSSDASDSPYFKNRGVGVPLAHTSAAGEQRLWNEYGVTPSPVSDLTAKVLIALGLHLSPIKDKQFRGNNVLAKYPGGLDVTFVRTGGPAEKAGMNEVDIVVVLQGQGVSTVQGLDVVLQDTLKNSKIGGSKVVSFDVLRNGETVRVNVPLPADALALVSKDFKGSGSEDLKPAQRRLEICEASELSAEEAATLAKSESSREILYLHDGGQIVPLRRKPETLLSESDLLSAVAKSDPDIEDAYSIDLELKPAVAQRFAEETRRLSQQTSPVRLAILVSGKLHSAPRLVSEILNGKMRITGRFTKQEAEQLAADLIRNTDRPVLAPMPTRSNEN